MNRHYEVAAYLIASLYTIREYEDKVEYLAEILDDLWNEAHAEGYAKGEGGQ